MCFKVSLNAVGIVDQNRTTIEAYIKDSFCFSIKAGKKSNFIVQVLTEIFIVYRGEFDNIFRDFIIQEKFCGWKTGR